MSEIRRCRRSCGEKSGTPAARQARPIAVRSGRHRSTRTGAPPRRGPRARQGRLDASASTSGSSTQSAFARLRRRGAQPDAPCRLVVVADQDRGRPRRRARPTSRARAAAAGRAEEEAARPPRRAPPSAARAPQAPRAAAARACRAPDIRLESRSPRAPGRRLDALTDVSCLPPSRRARATID